MQAREYLGRNAIARMLVPLLTTSFRFFDVSPVPESRRQLAVKTDLEKRRHFVKLARVNRSGKFNRQERFEKRIIPANLELAERLARANGMLRSVANQVFRLRLVSPLSMLNHLNPSQKNSHLFNAGESSSLFHCWTWVVQHQPISRAPRLLSGFRFPILCMHFSIRQTQAMHRDPSLSVPPYQTPMSNISTPTCLLPTPCQQPASRPNQSDASPSTRHCRPNEPCMVVQSLLGQCHQI